MNPSVRLKDRVLVRPTYLLYGNDLPCLIVHALVYYAKASGAQLL